MAVTKTVITPGNGPAAKKEQVVKIQYTGWLKDPSKPDNKGNEFDSSRSRGPFVVPIGVGKLIRGWDEGVVGMNVGEQALFDITSDYAYGPRGFPPIIPPNSDLIFEVELQGIQ